MIKKVIIILIIIIALGLIGWGIFVFQSQRGTTGAGEEISIRDFFPFGRTPDTSETPTPTTQTPSQNINGSSIEIPEVIPALRKISEDPVAGAFAFNESGKTVIRFVDRATGHIFETDDTTLNIKRISNTTIPTVYEAFWISKNSVVLRHLREDGETVESVILRMIEEDNGLSGPFEFTTELKQGNTGVSVRELQIVLNSDPETRVSNQGAGSPGQETSTFGPGTFSAVVKFQEKYSEEILVPQNLEEGTGIVDDLTREKLNELTGANIEIEESDEENLLETTLTFLPADITSLAYLEDTGKIFYLREDNLGTVGTLANSDGTQANQIFSSPAVEWMVEYVTGSTLSINSKPSFNSKGVLLTLNSSNGSTEKIIGDVNGLTSLISKDLSKVLFSESIREGINLNIFDRNRGETTTTGFETLPEKCIWSNVNTNTLYCAVPQALERGNYPDSWYKGISSFNDLIWRIELTGDALNSSPLTNPDSDFAESDIDATNLFADSTEEHLFFINKKDYSLWSYRLR